MLKAFSLALCLATVIGESRSSVLNGTNQELIQGCNSFKESNTLSTECSTAIHSRECLSITGFSNRDFAASGIYCQLASASDVYQLRVDDKLRYELLKRGSDRFDLLRVIKSKRGKWVGAAIYTGFKSSESLEDVEWLGYAMDAKEGESVYDYTEPKLNATFVETPTSYLKALHIANDYRAKSIDACELSFCDSTLMLPANSQGSVLWSGFCHSYWRAAAQLAELGGNNVEAANRYEKARTCVKDQIRHLAVQQVPISSYLRWKMAEISHLMAKSLVKAGRLQSAMTEVLVGLAHSPEQKQRRLLLISLGDLRLATNDVDGAIKAYRQAFEAVLLKGGMIETQNFWSYFSDSVGDLIAEIVSNNDTDMGKPSNYAVARTSMLLGVEKGTNINMKDVDQLDSIGVMESLGHKCIIDVESFYRFEDKNLDFCTHHILSSAKDINAESSTE